MSDSPGRPESEGAAAEQRPPDSFWREVPCGHPQDPVAWWGAEGPFCHCGGGLDLKDALPEQPPEAPGPIVPCDKCGCFPAIPPKPPASTVTSKGDPSPSEGAGEYTEAQETWRCEECGLRLLDPDEAAIRADERQQLIAAFGESGRVHIAELGESIATFIAREFAPSIDAGKGASR